MSRVHSLLLAPLEPNIFEIYDVVRFSFLSLSRKLSLTGECRLRGFSHRISPQLAIWRYKENAMVFKKNGRGKKKEEEVDVLPFILLRFFLFDSSRERGKRNPK